MLANKQTTKKKKKNQIFILFTSMLSNSVLNLVVVENILPTLIAFVVFIFNNILAVFTRFVYHN